MNRWSRAVRPILVLVALAASGCSSNSGAVNCKTNASICGGDATCNRDSGKCESKGSDCTTLASLCGQGTTCDASTKKCVPGTAADCRVSPSACATGTACNQVTGQCSPVDCRTDASLCFAGTTCSPTTGRCIPNTVNCLTSASLCGPGTYCDPLDHICVTNASCKTLDSCGGGTLCSFDGVCRADCRQNIIGTCPNQAICDLKTGVCANAASVNCKDTPSICWADQTCDTTSGYCREATVDSTLDFDVQLYDVSLTIDTATKAFAANAKLFLVATKATPSLTLDVAKTIDLGGGATYTPYTVSAVHDLAGHALVYTQDSTAGTLAITLQAALASGQAEVLSVDYAGATNPITDTSHASYETGLIYRAAKDGVDTLQTYSWPNATRNWLPSHDHPSDTARAIFHVTAPKALTTVLASGVLVNTEEKDATRTNTFVLREPVPTYAFFVGGRPWTLVHLGVVGGSSHDAFVYAADKDLPSLWWTVSLFAQNYVTDRLGADPFEHYSLLELPDPLGGMEHATVASVRDTDVDAAKPEVSRETVIHELMHDYFGNNAHAKDWGEFWLNESFASYLTADVLGAQSGTAAFRAAMDGWKTATFAPAQAAFYSDGPLHYEPATPDDVPAAHSFAALYAPYTKGPWVLHMLRVKLGDTKFYEFIKKFYEASRFKPYDTALFLTKLNEVSGEDYTAFVDQWLNQKGWPQLAIEWNTFDGDPAGTYDFVVDVYQTQQADWGTYGLALAFVADGAPAGTPPCVVTANFDAADALGVVQEAEITDCPYHPTGLSMPFTNDLFVEVTSVVTP
jgi:aminopeptidase N